MAQKMEQQEIIARINALCKEAGLTHDQLASVVYIARNNHLREIRREHQDTKIIMQFTDGVMLHEIKDRTVNELVNNWPATTRDLIKRLEHNEKGELGMMVNTNIPSHWATFPMSK